MTLEQICAAEQRSMSVRRHLGYDQHDQHVWCWLVHELKLYGMDHPFKVVGD